MNSVLGGGQQIASSPGRFTPGESVRSTHWIGGWISTGIDLDTVTGNIRFSSTYKDMNTGCLAHSLITILTELH
jgi:hypothetical protein